MSVTKSVSELGRPVAYYPRMAKWLGGDVAAAIFLCQFMYWRGKVGEREIHKTRAEIKEETGIGEGAQKRVTKYLQSLGFLTVEKKSVPARNYYRFDWDAIDRSYMLFAEESSANESTALDGSNKPHQSGRIDRTTSETTTETTTEITLGETAVTPRTKPLSPLKDDLANAYQEAFTAVMPASTWADVAKERGQLSNIAKKTRALLPDVPYESEGELAQALLTAFREARETETHDYWSGAPFTPSAFATRWDKIVARLAKRWDNERKWQEAFR